MSDDLVTSNAAFASSPDVPAADATPHGEYRTTYDPDGGRPSVDVALAVASVLGTDPAALDPPLYDVVDPDALDSLFTTRDGAARLVFEIASCRVTVRADGTIRVCRTD